MKSSDRRPFRTLFISDIHLGTKGCQAERFLDFLREHDADQIYLIGDIVDGWRLRRGWYWPQTHNDVIQKLLRKVRAGARLTYVPGNHDEFLREYVGMNFGGIDIVDRCIHETADGRRLLVIHGDEFDGIIRHAPWLSMLGAGAYDFAMATNVLFNRIRRRLGLSYWSLSAWAKQRVKNAVKIISNFETALVAEARRAGTEGVICGHIHHATMHHDYGIEYINTGDWVESCTAVVEHHDGRMEVIHWPERRPSTQTETVRMIGRAA